MVGSFQSTVQVSKVRYERGERPDSTCSLGWSVTQGSHPGRTAGCNWGEGRGPGSFWSLQYEAALITASTLTLYFQRTHPLCESMSTQREKAMGQEAHSAIPFIRTAPQALEHLSFQTPLEVLVEGWGLCWLSPTGPTEGPLMLRLWA